MPEGNLLILDLDDTLISARAGIHEEDSAEPDYIMSSLYYSMYKRPGLDAFLKQAFELFEEVAIWTSASKEYCNLVVNHMLGGVDRYAFVWSRDKCTRVRNSTFEYHVKDIKKVLGLGYDKSKILAVDDSPYKWERSYGNYIPIFPWDWIKGEIDKNSGRAPDRELEKLSSYLKLIIDNPDYRELDKRNWSSYT